MAYIAFDALKQYDHLRGKHADARFFLETICGVEIRFCSLRDITYAAVNPALVGSYGGIAGSPGLVQLNLTDGTSFVVVGTEQTVAKDFALVAKAIGGDTYASTRLEENDFEAAIREYVVSRSEWDLKVEHHKEIRRVASSLERPYARRTATWRGRFIKPVAEAL